MITQRVSTRLYIAPGLSIVELLVAMAITSLIMLALFSLVGTTSDSYTRTQRAVNTISQARAFMRFFEGELSTKLPSLSLVHQDSTGPGNSDELAFVRVLSIDEQEAFEAQNDPGDLGTVIYYVDFLGDLDDANRPVTPTLFRKKLGPAATQADIINAAPSSPPAGNPLTDEPLVLHVLDFKAQPKYYNPAGALQDWTTGTSGNPILIEVTIRFIDDSSAQRYKTKAAWNALATTTNPTVAERQIIQEYRRTIMLGN